MYGMYFISQKPDMKSMNQSNFAVVKHQLCSGSQGMGNGGVYKMCGILMENYWLTGKLLE
jgi:hypothetical protein